MLSFSPLSSMPISSSFGTSTNVFSGVSASGLVGSFAPTVSVVVPGVTASGQAGSFSPNVTLAGTQGAGQVGSFAPQVSLTLDGVQASGSAGAFTKTVLVTLAGNQATGNVGNFSLSISNAFTLTGVVGTAQLGTFVWNSNKTLVGVQANSSVNSFGNSLFFTLPSVFSNIQTSGFIQAVIVSKTLPGVSASGIANGFTPGIANEVNLNALESQDSAGFVVTSQIWGGGGKNPWRGDIVLPEEVSVEDAILWDVPDKYYEPEFEPVIAKAAQLLRYPTNQNMIMGSGNNLIAELLL